MSIPTFSVFGDSVSTFKGAVSSGNRVYYEGAQIASTGVNCMQETWWMRVIEHFGGRLLSNGSYSGSMVEGAGFPAASSMQRVRQVRGADGQAPDVILVFMGINDYGWGSAAAQAAGRSEAVPECVDLASVPQAVAGVADGRGLDGFARAYDLMLARLAKLCPEADVWCMTLVPGRVQGAAQSTFCYSLRGIDIDCYNDAIRAAAARHGCLIADIARCGFDYETSDGTHPSAKGMEQLAAMTVACMGKQGFGTAEQPLDKALFPKELRSARLCTRPNCIGCEHARGTGNQWSCVCEKHLS